MMSMKITAVLFAVYVMQFEFDVMQGEVYVMQGEVYVMQCENLKIMRAVIYPSCT